MLKPLGVAGGAGRPAAAAAGLRLVVADPRDHRRHAGAGRRATCRACSARCWSGCRCWRSIAIAEPYRVRRLTSFLRSVGRSVRQRLPADQRADGGRPRRMVRRRPGRHRCRSSSYLPEAHTDFIFAVIAEELGFVGVCAGDRACTRCWPAARSGSACSAWRCAATSPATARSASRCGSACRASCRSA